MPFGIQIISTYLLRLYVSKLQPRYFGYLGVVVEECERHIIRAVNYVRILRNRQSSVTVDDIIQIRGDLQSANDSAVAMPNPNFPEANSVGWMPTMPFF